MKFIEKKKQEIFLYENHKKPTTRRDFLAAGLLGMGAYALTPSLANFLLAQRAYGLDCKSASGVQLPPAFLCIDLAGGACIAGSNVIVGKKSGQEDFLTSYRSLGLPDDMSPAQPNQINRELGLLFHSDSAMLRGILATTTPETRANIDGAIFCTSSSDDTGNNPHNPMYWIHAAGAQGELVSLLGTRNNESGGRSRAPASSLNPAARPVQIQRPQDALGLVNVGKLAQMLSSEKAQKVLKAMEQMSTAQLAKFNNKDLPAQIKELIQCGYIQSADMISKFDAASLDPRNDADIAAVFGALNNGDLQKSATIAKLVMDGFAGAATIEKGGYDYHNGSRATGELRDEEAGQLIGQLLEFAARKQRDVVVYVFSDGSVASNGNLDNSANGRGKGIWSGDSGQRGAAFMLVFSPNGKPPLRDSSRRQVGAFKDSGAVDNSVNKISSNPENLAKAVVANYLAIEGREGELAKIIGADPFGADLGQYLIFDKKA